MRFSQLGLICSIICYSSLSLASTKSADTASNVYISSRGDGNVTLCQADSSTGALTQCHTVATGFTVPEGVTINPAGTLLYVVNNNVAGTVSKCDISSADGSLSGCTDAGGNNFYFPDAVAFNSDGSIAYIVNASAPKDKTISISACLVDHDTGKLSNCTLSPSDSFVAPSWIQINSKGNLAYISNFTGNSISVCHVKDQRVFNCNSHSGSDFSLPDSVTLNKAETFAYITNNGQSSDHKSRSSANKVKNNEPMKALQQANSISSVITCAVDAKTGLLSHCENTASKFTGSGLAFDKSGNFAYISNFAENTVTVCASDSASGQLSNCQAAPYGNYNQPTGIAIK